MANHRATLGFAPFSLSGTGGSADATHDFELVSTNFKLDDFALAHFAQLFRFGARAPSTAALNCLQSCFVGDNFKFLFPTSKIPGFPLGAVTTSLPQLSILIS